MSSSGSSTPTSRPSTPITPSAEQAQPQAQASSVRISVIQRIGQAAPLQTQAMQIPASTSATQPSISSTTPAPLVSTATTQPQSMPITTQPSAYPTHQQAWSLAHLFASAQRPFGQVQGAAQPQAPAPLRPRAVYPQALPFPLAQQPQQVLIRPIPTYPQPFPPAQWPQQQAPLPYYPFPTLQPIAPLPLPARPIPSLPPFLMPPPPLSAQHSLERLLRGALALPRPIRQRTISQVDFLRHTEVKARATALIKESVRLGLDQIYRRICRIIFSEFGVYLSPGNYRDLGKKTGLKIPKDKDQYVAKKKAAEAFLKQGDSIKEAAEKSGLSRITLNQMLFRKQIHRPTAQELEESALSPEQIPFYPIEQNYNELENKIKVALKAFAKSLFAQGISLIDVQRKIKERFNIRCTANCMYWWQPHIELRVTQASKVQKRSSTEPSAHPAPKFQLVVVPEPQDDSSSSAAEPQPATPPRARPVFSPVSSPVDESLDSE